MVSFVVLCYIFICLIIFFCLPSLSLLCFPYLPCPHQCFFVVLMFYVCSLIPPGYRFCPNGCVLFFAFFLPPSCLCLLAGLGGGGGVWPLSPARLDFLLHVHDSLTMPPICHFLMFALCVFPAPWACNCSGFSCVSLAPFSAFNFSFFNIFLSAVSDVSHVFNVHFWLCILRCRPAIFPQNDNHPLNAFYFLASLPRE